MRCLKIKPLHHLDGEPSLTMVIPCGTRRTKRRTFKKWLTRARKFAQRQRRPL